MAGSKGHSGQSDGPRKTSIDVESEIFEEVVSVQSEKSSHTELFAPGATYQVHRRLKPRHIQLIGIGGTIGTVLFVQIATPLSKGGPASLFIAFAAWCVPIVCLTNSTAEMVTYFPLPSPFVRLAGRCLDDALEVMSGWNFLLLQVFLVPFEITAFTLVLHFWADNFSPAASIVPQVAAYMIINFLCPVSWFGEIEYFLAIFKVLLIVGLILFTFITMVGGNPQGHAYGFTFWKNPGSFAEWYYTGDLGRFLGFAACIAQASYTVSGPDYVAMTAGEAINPRRNLPIAFKGVIYRLTFFFVLGSLCVGIICPYNDPEMLEALANGAGGAAASPYVVGMNRMGIKGLPSVVNAAILLAIFSAGNSYFYCSSRTLYGMSLAGHAPKLFSYCTKNGVPVVANIVVAAVAMLSFLQLSNSANQILTWLVSFGTAAQLINYCLMNVTFLRFFYACKKQGVDRNTFPYKGWLQPYCAYFCAIACGSFVFLAGFAVFLKGNWQWSQFIFSYIMIPIDLGIFLFWKFWKKTKFKRLDEIDLHSGLEEVEAHEQSIEVKEPKNVWSKIGHILIGDF
ncbi:General amino acid permease AGP2 [Wickerhamiella sorbophila]|uniref:General amino acid permease AGP2 n=1 Tax=Wickerhamiella sorbophila TaxID=45607 RepID=A0A2T0FIG2_9ASCO|nr:General amino acid permease AGP2 [Wickerhamiella sorbophila]PRT54794.1 General amino acid permease AGP2 [Wickerhamiella sorbophila]